MATKPFRIAIVGIGAIAELIARALASIERARLVAGSCRTESKGRAFASTFSCEWFADTAAMFDAAKPDVAIICTPSGTHLEMMLEAARRGIHVLCEKPLEITVERVRAMIEAARRGGVHLGGLFPQRFNPVNIEMREAIAQGRLGTLAAISAAVPWWRDDAYYAADRWQGKAALDGGGALMNQAIHTIDLMQWFAAATMHDLPAGSNPVEALFAITARRGHDPKAIEVEDTAAVTMRFRSGAIGQLFAATSAYPGRRRRYLIAGRDGSMEVVEDQLIAFDFRTPLAGDERIRERFASPTRHAGGSADPMAISHLPHQRNIEDFLAAMEEGRASLLTGEESLKAVEIIEACYRSARAGTAVRVGI